MTRRKGELTSAQVDRDYPFQVIMPASRCTLAAGKAIDAFCKDLSLAPRGHSVVRNDEWHHVFCFRLQADAERLMANFGGEWFDPTTRGRGQC